MAEVLDNNPCNFHIKKGSDFVVKELFKDISSEVKAHFSDTSNIGILDVGCAAGELVTHLKRDTGTQGAVMGLDYGEALVANAKERFGSENIEFVVGDAQNFQLGKKFDVITACSLVSYFDSPEKVFRTMLDHLTDQGLLIVTGLFNEHDIDVRLKYRVGGEGDWREGFHQFPLSGIEKMLSGWGYKMTVKEQVMPFDIPKGHENPTRSWSVDLNGVRHNMNGFHLVFNIKLLTISKA